MHDDFSSGYRHTQYGLWFILLYSMGVGMLFLALFVPGESAVNVTLAATGALMLLLGMSFHHLSVIDEGDRLAIRFGPISLFQKRIRYIDIRAVEVARTSFLDGWGIHHSLRGGWVWNIHGRDCVMIDHGKKTWVGTDDAENLAAFLKARIVDHPVES